MDRILWNSKTGMMALQDKLDCISNNIANINTEGYKEEKVSFQDLVSESLNRTGYPTDNTKAFTGTGVKSGEWIRNFTQGPLTATSINTDLAIDGEGLFRVTKPDGTKAYTRAGSFNIDSAGNLVDDNNDRLDIDFGNNKVKLTADNFKVDKNGDVYINNSGTYNKVGKINLYTAVGQDSFVSEGNNLYVPASGVNVTTSKNADIYQGRVENSNVDMATEMTDMLITERAFELNSKGITTADEMWSLVNNMTSK